MDKDKLRKAGFKKARKRKPRLIMSVYGEDGRGKTHFCLTTPPPIAYFSLDIGEEGVVDKFISDKEIWIKHVKITDTSHGERDADIDVVKQEARNIMDDFIESYNTVLLEARTVVIDTATELWELLRLAHFGKTTKIIPTWYTEANAEYRRLITNAFNSDANLLLIHSMRDIYENDQRTGELEMSACKVTKGVVQASIQMFRKMKKGKVVFDCHVDKCRTNEAMMDVDVPYMLTNFPALAVQMVPGTKKGDWI